MLYKCVNRGILDVVVFSKARNFFTACCFFWWVFFFLVVVFLFGWWESWVFKDR